MRVHSAPDGDYADPLRRVDGLLEAAEYIAPDDWERPDECNFAPFGDDASTARDITSQKIRAPVAGTELAARAPGV